MVEGKIVEVLTGAGVGNAENVLTSALPGGVGGADNDVDGALADGVVGLMMGGMEGDMMPEESAIGVFLSL